MDIIAKHARKLIQPYVQSEKSDAIVASAKRLAKLVLAETDLLEKHRKLLLSRLQWLISEADGKYRTRFRSKQVVELAMHSPSSTIKINHEHVFARREITARLLLMPESSDVILDDVVGCIVTQKEHSKLSSKLSGWRRYSEAGILVLDMSTLPPQVFCTKPAPADPHDRTQNSE